MDPSLTAEYGEGEKITILPGTTDTARSIYSTQIGSVERISWRESYQIWEERIFSEININVLTKVLTSGISYGQISGPANSAMFLCERELCTTYQDIRKMQQIVFVWQAISATARMKDFLAIS